MQFLAVLNMFIMKTYLNSIFKNDLKKNFFRKMFIVTDLVSLRLLEFSIKFDTVKSGWYIVYF